LLSFENICRSNIEVQKCFILTTYQNNSKNLAIS
jgi:hypothetical protein